MDGPGLSWREQRILRQIELGLGQDADLELRLRTMRLGRLNGLRRLLRRLPVGALVLLALCAFGLFTAGAPAAAAAAWAVFGATAAGVLLWLACRLGQRLRRGH
ncbi:DUF3040 domain-containing protein [Kitasatospora sp. KL5]|uniref:DUF3040 domain-containing protein n=1 Tax=Kitasatospora sp. KL5 TaxID=3425125 RepID=UPI003D6E8518